MNAAFDHRGPVMHPDLAQGSDEWLAARRGLITASEMKLLMTAGGKVAENDKSRAHIWELAAQRISGYVEPSFISDDMLRGYDDELAASRVYADNVAPVEHVGFITNSRWGFTLGYSPDGLVGGDGLIECKSRRQRFQIETIVRHIHDDAGTTIPDDHVLQCQFGLLVSERKWLDFISYSGGLPMAVIRVLPAADMQERIVAACEAAEAQIAEVIAKYRAAANGGNRLFPTERRIEQEMFT
jgi:hypothetical protein